MSARLVEGVAASADRLLARRGGPDLVADSEQHPASTATGTAFRCPVCDAPRTDYGPQRERYDEDYDYYWGSVRMPLWIALIWQVPWRQRLDIFVIGFVLGVVIAGLGLLWGLLLSRY